LVGARASEDATGGDAVVRGRGAKALAELGAEAATERVDRVCLWVLGVFG
jgi:hypothetical protein